MKHYSAKPSARKHWAVLPSCPTLLQDAYTWIRLPVTTKLKMHIARDCVMSSNITCAMLCQHFVACRDSQEASLPLYYDQWWTSHVVGFITNHIYFSSWKEVIAVSFGRRKFARERGRQRWPANDAITLERSVFRESQTVKTLKTPQRTL